MGVLPLDMVRDEDIEQVLTSMVLDYKLETVLGTTSEVLYKASNYEYGAAYFKAMEEVIVKVNCTGSSFLRKSI